MIGNSFSAIVDNAVNPMLNDLFRGYCTWNNKKLIFGDKVIRVIGAHDEGSVRAIQGNTHSLAYVDELTTIPWSFVDMLTTRLSQPWSKMIATCNPNSPVHPVKEKFIDCVDGKYAYSLHFEVDDNPILTQEYKNDLRTKYTGLFYRRYILGEWVAAEGSIYSDFSRDSHVLYRAPHYADNYFCGVDYGIHNAFAAVLIGHNNTHSPHFWVEKEYYWDSKKTYRQKLNSELADDLQQFIDGYNVRGIYLDPSAESFEVELKRRGMRVIQAKNDVFPGITFVANLISNHELKVVQSCTNLIGEIEQYVWDSAKAERGVEEPVKKNDHACVTGDTLISTVEGDIPIRDLAAKAVRGFLFNFVEYEKGIIFEDSYTNASLTKQMAQVMKITLRDGTVLKATPDHNVFGRISKDQFGVRKWEMKDLSLRHEIAVWKYKDKLKFPITESGGKLSYGACRFEQISSIEALEKPEDVYCLAALTNRTMIANGILVKNCDALRYCLYTAFGIKKNLTWGDVVPDSGKTLGPPGVKEFKRTSDCGFR